MSHFNVLVVTDEKPTQETISKVLMPWHEYECTGYEEYLVDIDRTDEILAEYETCKDDYESLAEFAEVNYGIKASYPTKDESRFIDKTNPNAKWDWWVIGGRWAGFISNKNTDILQKKEVPVEQFTQERAESAAKKWDEFHNYNFDFTNFYTVDGEDFDRSAPVIKELQKAGFYYFDEIKELQKTSREKFIEKYSGIPFTTFAVVKDGTWFEKGKMGWFACVSDKKENWEEEFKALWDSILPDQWLTIVDCHI